MGEKPGINIIKGLDRIILLLAILSLFFGFYLGTSSYHDQLKWNPEYTKWRQDPDRWQKIQKDKERKNPTEYTGLDLEFAPPNKFRKVPIWQTIAAGFITSIVFFAIVFFGLKGITRLIRKISLWIIRGFKE